MRHAPGPIAVLLAMMIPSCGGGSSPNPPSTLPPAPATTTNTQPPASGKKPVLSFKVDKRAGQSPVTVNFDLCASRDGSGGTNLTYLAGYGGGSPSDTHGCHFSHTYHSTGVTVDDTKLEVRDSAGKTDDDTVSIKSYVGVTIHVDQTTGCAKTVIATAQLQIGASARGEVGALAEVDRVQFEVKNVAGQSLGKKDGNPQGAETWTTGTWNVNDSTKVRVFATVFAKGIVGDDVPEDTRPPCGS